MENNEIKLYRYWRSILMSFCLFLGMAGSLEGFAQTVTLSDIVAQSSGQCSSNYPAGVPTSWGWNCGQGGAGVGYRMPPSNFTSLTGWGQIYPQSGTTIVPCHIYMKDYQVYGHLVNGGWIKLQDSTTGGLFGAHYVADFSGNSSYPWNQTRQSDGSYLVDSPSSGYNDHFWPTSSDLHGRHYQWHLFSGPYEN